MVELDYKRRAGLVDLVEKITTPSSSDSLDAALLKEVKSIARSSDQNVKATFDIIYARLGTPNSQVRLLALELCAELFRRSQYFRSLLASKFTGFLELTVGFKLQSPLPGPQASAERLRELALELVEVWNSQHGSRHIQISLAYSYLKNTLKFQFPEIDARRAAQEVEQRRQEETSRHLAQQRYQQLLEEWSQKYSETKSLLQQFTEAFAIVEETGVDNPPLDGVRSGSCTAKASDPSDDAGDEGLQWEDVLHHDGDKKTPSTLSPGVDGLPTYAPEDGVNGIGTRLDEAETETTLSSEVQDAAVVEALEDLYKLICNQVLPALQRDLQTIIRADGGEPGQAHHAEREGLLRSLVALKTEATAAKERYDSGTLHLHALVLAQKRRHEALEAERNPPSSTAVHNSCPPSTSGLERQPLREFSEDMAVAVDCNPYRYIHDPAAPRHHVHRHSSSIPAPSVTAGRGDTLRAPLSRQAANPSGSKLPPSIRASLAAQAPVLPAGAFVRVWDSAAPPVYVSGHGMEVSNHWGPVDVHQELPANQLDEFFLVQSREKKDRTRRSETTSGPANVAPQSSVQILARTGEVPNGSNLGMLQVGAGVNGRAQRAADRAYNDAVISGAAGGDAHVARALQESDAVPEGSQSRQRGRKRVTKKPPVIERLKRKLLGGRAVAATLQDAAHTEREQRREKFNNQW